MKVAVIEALADAIMQYEGWYPTSRSYRNRNPGNLRAVRDTQPVDEHGYRVFESLVDGYGALLADLTCKITGRTTTGLSSYSTIAQVFEVYAPRGDGNNPVSYAAFVAHHLNRVYGRADISGTWRLRDVYYAVGQEVPGGVAAA